ncbi:MULTISPECIES: hypothetical protein [Marinobacter]|uniref:hypothetical protein n=1 Tax=Marinobacter TaxID=2742 RepID=UPI002354D0F1|nr:hypothetical protein [Marinobacter sp.]
MIAFQEINPILKHLSAFVGHEQVGEIRGWPFELVFEPGIASEDSAIKLLGNDEQMRAVDESLQEGLRSGDHRDLLLQRMALVLNFDV